MKEMIGIHVVHLNVIETVAVLDLFNEITTVIAPFYFVYRKKFVSDLLIEIGSLRNVMGYQGV